MAATTRRKAVQEPDAGDAPLGDTVIGGDVTASPERQEPEPHRRARRMASGDAIRDAAASLFLEKGYQGTSMDDIAAAAHISKQTIYTHVADKETLFADLVLGNADRVDAFVQGLVQAVREAPDARTALRELARSYIHIVSRLDVLRLRRLVIGESGRFPEVARAYYEKVPQRMYATLAELLTEVSTRGNLRVDDPPLAARQFAWLILGIPLDRGMFLGPNDALSDAELDRIADAGVSVFLAAYGG